MKQLIIAAVAVILCATGGLAQSRKGRASASAEPAIINIQQIDFKNYTFPLNGKSYKLIDGFYAENTAPGAQWKLEMADGPYYGDLTGDKKEETAFVLRYGPVASPNMAEVRVYTLLKGKAALLATFQVATGVSCELVNYIKIEDGTLFVERVYGDAAHCDHNEIIQYRWNGTGFMPVGDVKRVPCHCL